MPSLIFNGVTYGISQTRFEATRELLARFAEGHTLGVAMSLTDEGARHHLFVTTGGRSRWWNDVSGLILQDRRLRFREEAAVVMEPRVTPSEPTAATECIRPRGRRIRVAGAMTVSSGRRARAVQ